MGFFDLIIHFSTLIYFEKTNLNVFFMIAKNIFQFSVFDILFIKKNELSLSFQSFEK